MNQSVSKTKEQEINVLQSSEMDIDQVISTLKTSTKSGLVEEEAKARLDNFGANELEEEEQETLFSKFLDKFKEPMILLLLGSALVSILLGKYEDAASIFVAILIVCTVGFVQEYRSDKALDALKELTNHAAFVIRENVVHEINATELVPGDLITFKMGDRVPADVRIIEVAQLSIDEAVFTGESEPSKKHINTIKLPKYADIKVVEGKEDSGDIKGRTPYIADCKNCAFMGTLVSTGNGKGIVVGTGQNTELGKVNEMLQEIEDKKSPLQVSMDRLAKQISFLSMAIIAVIFVIGVLSGKPWLDMFQMGISLAVAAIPEGLPIVVTVTLGMGVMRMASKNAIVRKLPSVEALGATSVICVDKTGTLTQNEMTVTKIYCHADADSVVELSGVGYAPKGEFLRYKRTGVRGNPETMSILSKKEDVARMLLTVGNVCNNSNLKTDGALIGQPTEGALLVAALKSGMPDQRNVWQREKEIPFSSEEKWMAVQAKNSAGKSYFFVKGAPESLLLRCKHHYVNEGQVQSLSNSDREVINNVVSDFAGQSLRVMALAYGESLENLVFCGIVGIYDPPRPGVKEAIRTLEEAKVKIVMITGDSKKTAVSIAKELGIIPPNANEDRVALSPADLEDEQTFESKAPDAAVYYRMAPIHKMKIVRAYQHKGYIVAMTGDGVNDAPALKLADIGISMGKSGTDVSKEAAEMVLVDDNFATIEVAIEEGKSIFNNIKNFLRYQLATSITCMCLIIYCTLAGIPLPLNPTQILWINIIMDGPPAQSLGVEPTDPDVMKQPPRDPKQPILTVRLMATIVLSAIVMTVGTLYVFLKEMSADNKVTSRDLTMTFTTFVLFQAFNALNCRHERKSLFQIGLFSNKAFLFAVGGSVLGQVALIYLPFMNFVFETETLSLMDWVFCTGVASSVWIVEEVLKLFVRMQAATPASMMGAHIDTSASKSKRTL